MSFKICDTQVPIQQRCCPKVQNKRLICYTPDSTTFDGQASLLTQPNLTKARVLTSLTLARLPVNALIDRIEYVAYNGTFSSKMDFNIGLGQLNGPITSPLIVDGTDTIANQGVGGAFDIVCDNISGANSKPLVTETLINCVGGSITGTLRVDIYYHVKD